MLKPTTTAPTPLNTTNQETKLSIELQEQIRCRAYKLYEERGRVDGHELDDWLQAESEKTEQSLKAVAA